MNSTFYAVVLVSALALPVAAAEVQTKWSGLAAIVSGKPVVVRLNPTGVVEGRVISVAANALRLEVTRSTDTRYTSGREHEVPRASVDRMEMIRRGVAGRIALTAIGAFGGFLLGGALFDKPDQIPVWQASSGGVIGGFGGYFLGSRLDRRRVTIRLLPD